MSNIHLILLSTFIFTAIVLVLVAIILMAKSKLVPGGNVNITINNEYVELERLSQIENDRVVTEVRTKIKVLQIPPDKYPDARKTFQQFWDDTTYVLMFEPKKTKKSS